MNSPDRRSTSIDELYLELYAEEFLIVIEKLFGLPNSILERGRKTQIRIVDHEVFKMLLWRHVKELQTFYGETCRPKTPVMIDLENTGLPLNLKKQFTAQDMEEEMKPLRPKRAEFPSFVFSFYFAEVMLISALIALSFRLKPK